MNVRTSIFVVAVVGSLGLPARAEPRSRVIVDRVVAVVDDEVVTLVELRRRARPFLLRLDAASKGAELAAAESTIYRELAGTLVDERIYARAARAMRLSVSVEEIEKACDLVAKTNQLTRVELFEQAALQGMDEAFYREELARQILRQKVVRIVVPSRIYEEHRGAPEAENIKAIDDFMKTWIEQQKRALFIEVRL